MERTEVSRACLLNRRLCLKQGQPKKTLTSRDLQCWRILQKNTLFWKVFRSRNKKFEIFLFLEIPRQLSGVPIIHGRVTKFTYQHVTETVRRRLSTWKMKSLSRAARLVLIRTTLMAIPLYIMQTVSLPVAVINQIEQIFRRFF